MPSSEVIDGVDKAGAFDEFITARGGDSRDKELAELVKSGEDLLGDEVTATEVAYYFNEQKSNHERQAADFERSEDRYIKERSEDSLKSARRFERWVSELENDEPIPTNDWESAVNRWHADKQDVADFKELGLDSGLSPLSDYQSRIAIRQQIHDYLGAFRDSMDRIKGYYERTNADSSEVERINTTGLSNYIQEIQEQLESARAIQTPQTPSVHDKISE